MYLRVRELEHLDNDHNLPNHAAFILLVYWLQHHQHLLVLLFSLSLTKTLSFLLCFLRNLEKKKQNKKTNKQTKQKPCLMGGLISLVGLVSQDIFFGGVLRLRSPQVFKKKCKNTQFHFIFQNVKKRTHILKYYLKLFICNI